ncbi:hypothetical protein K488DRAFT_82198 [Vararia minispora EC-137]|uniref:Uncharacterized protein n=1 Tax=Vararia minispora EC-137 TaxID=1314806 RepID=A0ACB8QYS2_9AGAM|nr:hypothetical protein K488DRAFT_82198 [Vararia minispora EC-137]
MSCAILPIFKSEPLVRASSMRSIRVPYKLLPYGTPDVPSWQRAPLWSWEPEPEASKSESEEGVEPEAKVAPTAPTARHPRSLLSHPPIRASGLTEISLTSPPTETTVHPRPLREEAVIRAPLECPTPIPALVLAAPTTSALGGGSSFDALVEAAIRAAAAEEAATRRLPLRRSSLANVGAQPSPVSRECSEPEGLGHRGTEDEKTEVRVAITSKLTIKIPPRPSFRVAEAEKASSSLKKRKRGAEGRRSQMEMGGPHIQTAVPARVEPRSKKRRVYLALPESSGSTGPSRRSERVASQSTLAAAGYA